MAIFPIIECESVVQVNDKLRIDCSKSFISKGESVATLVEIKPSEDDSYIDITGSTAKDLWLDWIYETSGVKTISLRITTDSTPKVITKTINVLTELEDYLYSADSDLTVFEHDILKYVKQGKSSFKNFHREAQTHIITYLDERGFVKTDGTKFVKTDIKDLSEVKQWSIFYTLYLIFKDVHNSPDDVFSSKANDYFSRALSASNRAILRIDTTGSGDVDEFEFLNISNVGMVRR